jgi:hypothetical protein
LPAPPASVPHGFIAAKPLAAHFPNPGVAPSQTAHALGKIALAGQQRNTDGDGHGSPRSSQLRGAEWV